MPGGRVSLQLLSVTSKIYRTSWPVCLSPARRKKGPHATGLQLGSVRAGQSLIPILCIHRHKGKAA